MIGAPPETAHEAPYNVYSHVEWMNADDYIRGLHDAGLDTAEIKRALLTLVFKSPVFGIRNYLYTQTKETDLVRIDPWVGQTLLDYAIECQRRRGYAQRVAEIKARQVGFTAWNLARGFMAALRPRMKVGVLVNDDDVAASLMIRVGEMYNNLPPWLRPMKRIDNVKQLILDNPNSRTRDMRPGLNSLFSITVPTSLRGFTPNYFIWSEASFCKQWREVNDGVISGMGLHDRSCVVLDTTPNGFDPFYWPLVERAVERNPRWVEQWDRPIRPTREDILRGMLGEPDDLSSWVPVFCPWRWHEEYTTKNESQVGQLRAMSEREVAALTENIGKDERYGGEEELELARRWGVSVYQLAWRRRKIEDFQEPDSYMKLLKFRQEYPSSWRGGFVTFGRGVFDPRGLEKLEHWAGLGSKYGVRPPLARGLLRRDEKRRIYLDQTFHSEWMEVRVWAMPSSQETYVMAVDTAQTYGHEGANKTVAQVFRRRDRKQVAVMSCKAPPNGEGGYQTQCELLYRMYNDAYLGIEMESDGYDLAWTLWGRGCRNQYFYRRFDTPSEKEPMQALGWETNRKSRWTMQNTIIAAIGALDENGKNEPDVIICDQETLDELKGVSRDPEGFIENTSGGEDDHFMAVGIALTIDEDPWSPGMQRRRPKVTEPQPNPILESLGLTPRNRGGRNHPTYDLL